MYKLNMYKLGRRVAAARALADLTQKELAERAGITQAVVARIERGQRPQLSIGSLYAVARALGVSLDELVGMGDEDKREPLIAMAHTSSAV